jgi:hypothetical protein
MYPTLCAFSGKGLHNTAGTPDPYQHLHLVPPSSLTPTSSFRNCQPYQDFDSTPGCMDLTLPEIPTAVTHTLCMCMTAHVLTTRAAYLAGGLSWPGWIQDERVLVCTKLLPPATDAGDMRDAGTNANSLFLPSPANGARRGACSEWN